MRASGRMLAQRLLAREQWRQRVSHPLVCAFMLVWGHFSLAVAGEYDPPAGYFATAQGLRGAELKAALHQIIRGHISFPYTSSSTDTWDILKDADRDPNNSANVLLVYNHASVNAAQEYNGGNGWNREHVWPQSLGGFNTASVPGSDVHNLRACNEAVNARRDDLEFDYGGSPVTMQGLTGTYADNDSFEPNDSEKGDLARIIFYMAIRYEGGGEIDLEMDDLTNGGTYSFGKLSTLLEWHLLDPVDEFERRRNARIYAYQGNRNPFIDHPEFAHSVFDPDYQPPGFVVSPTTSQLVSGLAGGPYEPSTQSFLISNTSAGPVALSLSSNVPWVVLGTSSVSLPVSSQASVEFSINAAVVPSSPGLYTGLVRVTDSTSGSFQDYLVRLEVVSLVSDFLAKQFTSSSPFNLANKSLTFTPDGSANFYRVRIRPTTTLPTDPANGTQLTLGDDDYFAVAAPPGRTFRIFGSQFPEIFIGSNGYVTFGSGDSEYSPTITDHYNRPRVSGLFVDLTPAPGQVSYRFLEDRFVATWQAVPLWSIGGSNTFQIEIFNDGRIRLTWLGITAIAPIVGLSQGAGVPSGFLDSNFIAAPLELSAQFENWVAGHGLQPIERGGTEHDSDADGLSNWSEFAFGMSPVGGQGQPLQMQVDGSMMIFRFFARDSGFSYSIESSADLALPFEPTPNIAVVPSAAPRTAPTGYKAMEFAVPFSGSGFYRVRATGE